VEIQNIKGAKKQSQVENVLRILDFRLRGNDAPIGGYPKNQKERNTKLC
jgi:hypothetical protein